MRTVPKAVVLLAGSEAVSPAVQAALRREGYEVELVTAREEAVEALRGARFQAMILDTDQLGAPADLLRGLRARSSLAVIAVSSQPTLQSAIAVMRMGVSDFLVKPLESAAVLASLDEALDRRRDALELVSIRRVVRVFNSLHSLESTYEELRRSIAELFEAERCSLALLDADRGELVAQTPAYGASGEIVPRHRFKLDQSRVSKLILANGEPYVSNDVPADPLFEPAMARGLRNLLAAPLRTPAGPVGFIYLTNRGGGFSRLEGELLVAIGEFVAVALRNAHSFDDAYKASITDPLTELYNRRFFDARLRQEFERVKRSSGSLGLMFVDLDRFKQINDEHGHEAGNLVLTTVARIIRQNCRSADVPARWGGDEFTVLLTEADPASLEIIARRVSSGIQETNWGPVGPVTATLGVAVMPQDAATLEELMKAADEAMYLAKSRGRNTYALASELPHSGSAAS